MSFNSTDVQGRASAGNDEAWLGMDQESLKAQTTFGGGPQRMSLKTQSMNTDDDDQRPRVKKRPLNDDNNGDFQLNKKRRPNGGLGTKESVELLNAHYFAKPLSMNPWDVEDFEKGDVNECTLYVEQILENWKSCDDSRRPMVTEEVKVLQSDGSTITKKEERLLPVHDYFKNYQVDLKPRMRTILFCWLIDVHQKFKLRETTLWTAFQICDMFLSLVNVHRNRLQLVGSCCLWIASKYQDIYPPLAKDFVYISDRAFVRPDLMKCEELICNKLAFNFTTPTVYNFLMRYIKVAVFPIKKQRRKERVKWLTLYAAERVIICHEALLFKVDELAAGLICTALGMTGSKWSQTMVDYTGYSMKALKLVCRLTRKVVLKFDDPRHKAVIKKYQDPKRGAVAKLRKK